MAEAVRFSTNHLLFLIKRQDGLKHKWQILNILFVFKSHFQCQFLATLQIEVGNAVLFCSF